MAYPIRPGKDQGTFHSRISHRERMLSLLSGQKPDRPPLALWRHFPVDDQLPDRLAAATLNFQKTFDFDLVKVTPASSFCLKDWGAEDAWEGNPEGTRRYTRFVVQSPQDWESLKWLPPTSTYLAYQLECLAQVKKQLGEDTPLVQTIFSPLSQAKNLAGAERLISHIRLFPEAVLKGLETIARTTRSFLEAILSMDVDGIFYAVQHAQAGLLTRDEFSQFGRDFDLPILKDLGSTWCNLVHLHGRQVYFDLVKDYPVQIINWHDRETQPALKAAYHEYKGILCGGINRETLVLASPDEIRREMQDAFEQVNGQRLLLGTGCVIPITAPYGNLMAARTLVETYES